MQEKYSKRNGGRTARCVFVFISFFSIAHIAYAETIDGVVKKLEEINSLREGLASTLNGQTAPITEQTFKTVCVPVGTSMKEWSAANALIAGQKSSRYRNPNHKAEGADLKAVEYLKRHKDTLYTIDQVTKGGKKGFQIYRRIDVQSSCLRCHGAKSERPEFVKTKYPKDLAYGFNVGDLRGIYSVWLPAETAVSDSKPSL